MVTLWRAGSATRASAPLAPARDRAGGWGGYLSGRWTPKTRLWL